MDLPELFYDAGFWLPLLERATSKTSNVVGVNNRELVNDNESIRMAYNMPEGTTGDIYGTFNLFNYAIFSWSFLKESFYNFHYSVYYEDSGVKHADTHMIYPHDLEMYGNYGTVVPRRFSNASLCINGFLDEDLNMDYLIHEITIFKLTLDHEK